MLRLFICVSIGFFGVLATILGIVAEVKHIKVDQVLVIGDNCLYPKNNTSWVIGLFAASSLLVSQFISNICGGCICCSFNKNKTAHTHHSTPTRRVAILCLVLSWITFVNACFLLLEGVALKFGEQYYYGHVERKNTNDNYNMAESCYIIKSGVLGGGAALSMFTCGLSMVYYVMATSLDVHGTQHNTNNNMVPMCCFNPNYNASAYLDNGPPVAYVAGFELPKRFDQSY